MNCIDTDLAIAFLNGDLMAKEQMAGLENEGDIHATSITVFELTYTKSGMSPKREIEFQRFLSTLKILPLDKLSALLAGRIKTELLKKGEMLHPEDLFIGSICLYNDMTLVTHNIKHFNKINGLKLTDWKPNEG